MSEQSAYCVNKKGRLIYWYDKYEEEQFSLINVKHLIYTSFFLLLQQYQ